MPQLPGLPVALAGVAVLVVAVGYVVFTLVRSLPAPTVSAAAVASHPFGTGQPALSWPRTGQAAVAVEGVGSLGVDGSRRPTPIASVAKVMTAYLVLRTHPLRHGAGPLIAVRPADVATYRADAGTGQSVVQVRAGERISERDALEGLLLPSGNNMATLLADWVAGSQGAFVARMNATARALGLSGSRYTSASGVQAGTVSTAADQVRLATLAMANPVFRQIVAMPQATLPVAGRVFNVDSLLGSHGIVGIKTGTTSQAGGCFVFAATARADGRAVLIVGAVLHQMPSHGAPSIIADAFKAALPLLASVPGQLMTRTAVTRGETVGYVSTSWAGRIPLKSARAVRLTGARGLPARTALAATARGGSLTVSAGDQHARVAVTPARSVPAASLGWRLTHP